MRINMKFLFAFIVLFIVETLIALFVHDTIIRPYIGDILVVILLYALIRGLVQKQIKFLPAYLFFFALFVELMQYFHVVNLLHLQGNKVASIIIGTFFDIKDVLCYLIGAVILEIGERRKLW